jgi:hypothetical protein
MKKELKDRVYKLTRNDAPLSLIIPGGGSPRQPLLWFDDDKGINRVLRYSANQKSCFEDEQDGQIRREHIDFIDGFLSVPKNNPVLQEFLHLHPLNGKKFVEVNQEKDAQQELEFLSMEAKAYTEADKLSIGQMENVARVLLGADVSKISTAELKRDIFVAVKRDPQGFLRQVNDPMLKLQSNVHLFFDKGLLSFRNKQKEVWYNTSTNKKKMLTVPFGEDPMFIVSSYLQSDDGIEALKMLEKLLED